MEITTTNIAKVSNNLLFLLFIYTFLKLFILLIASVCDIIINKKAFNSISEGIYG